MKMIRFTAALLIAVAATAAHAQQNNFDIKTQGTTTGNCHYSFDSTKGGFKITSHFLIHLPPQFQQADPTTGEPAKTTSEAQGVSTYKLDSNYNYAGGNVLDSTIQQSASYTLNKQRTELQVSRMKAGVFVGDPLTMDIKPAIVLLPNLDASSIQTFLYMATAHPTADNSYYAVLPQGQGNPQTVTVTWTPQSDATGTLDGKAVTVHHFSFGYSGKTFDVYGDSTNLLMEADVAAGPTTTSYIRTGFALDAAK
jgi:hypothetical protein